MNSVSPAEQRIVLITWVLEVGEPSGLNVVFSLMCGDSPHPSIQGAHRFMMVPLLLLGLYDDAIAIHIQ